MTDVELSRPVDGTGPTNWTAEADAGLGVAPGLVWAFQIHDDGTAQPLPVDQPVRRSRDGWLWLHFNLADARSHAWLTRLNLPPHALALLLSHDRHQQLHAMDGCISGVFADLVRKLDGVSDQVGHLRFVMTDDLLVSGRHHALTSVESARDALLQGQRRLPHAPALLELIFDHVADAIDRIADEVGRELDAIEDGLAARTTGDERARLGQARRTSVKLHRQLTGLRTVFHRLEHDTSDRMKPELRLAASKLAQRLDALDHDIVEMRDRARLLQEEIGDILNEETNQHLRVLSVLTTLFLPPTLVTGIFGMNTKGLPFADWDDAFLWASALLIGSSVAVYYLMKRIGVVKR